jgi:hypothetical protein
MRQIDIVAVPINNGGFPINGKGRDSFFGIGGHCNPGVLGEDCTRNQHEYRNRYSGDFQKLTTRCFLIVHNKTFLLDDK